MVDEVGQQSEAERQSAHEKYVLANNPHFPLRKEGVFAVGREPQLGNSEIEASFKRMKDYVVKEKAKDPKAQIHLQYSDTQSLELNNHTTLKDVIDAIKRERDLKYPSTNSELKGSKGNQGYEGQRTRTQRHNVATGSFNR